MTAKHTATNKKTTNVQHMHWHVDTILMVQFRLLGLVVVGLAYIIFQSLAVLYLILVAYILSVALESVVTFFTNRGISRGFALLITYVCLLVFVLSGFVLIVPFLLSQLSAIITTILNSIQAIYSTIATYGLEYIIVQNKRLPNYITDALMQFIRDPQIGELIQKDIQNNIAQIINLGSSYAQSIGNIAVSVVTGLFSFVGQFILVVILSVLFSIEKKRVMQVICSLWGKENYDLVYARLDRIYKKLGLWLKGQILLCAYIGIIVFIVLTVLSWLGLHLPNRGSLALIAGLTEFIPYLGPFLGGVPAALLALVHFGIPGFIVIILVYRLIQRTENNILIPLVMQKTLGISPLLIFLCSLLGGLLMGVLGFIIGVPIAVIISMLYSDQQ